MFFADHRTAIWFDRTMLPSCIRRECCYIHCRYFV